MNLQILGNVFQNLFLSKTSLPLDRKLVDNLSYMTPSDRTSSFIKKWPNIMYISWVWHHDCVLKEVHGRNTKSKLIEYYSGTATQGWTDQEKKKQSVTSIDLLSIYDLIWWSKLSCWSSVSLKEVKQIIFCHVFIFSWLLYPL